MLSDVYYPTVDNTNLETLQYVVTDGIDLHRPPGARHDLHGRAARTTPAAWRARSPRPRRAASTRSRREYVTDPDRNVVLMKHRVQAEAAAEAKDPELQALRPLRPDRERQRRRRRGQRRRRLGDRRRARPAIRCSSPPTPITATNAANRDYAQPVYAALDGAFAEASSGFAGTVERRARRSSTRRTRSARPTTTRPAATSSRSRASTLEDRRQGASSRSASAPRRPRRSAPPRARSTRQFDRALAATTGRAGTTTTRTLNKPPHKLPGLKAQGRARARGRVLPERERAQGVRGQDVPRRDRREPRLAVGPGDLGRRSERTRTSAPTARCSRATCTRRGRASSPTATSTRRARRRSSCSTASSSPTGRCRATASSTARPRPTRSGRSSTRPRTRS